MKIVIGKADVSFRENLPHALLGSADDALRLRKALARSIDTDTCLRWRGPQRVRWTNRRFIPRTLMYSLCIGDISGGDVVEANCANARECIEPTHLIRRPRLDSFGERRKPKRAAAAEPPKRDPLSDAYAALARFDAAEALMPSLKRARFINLTRKCGGQ